MATVPNGQTKNYSDPTGPNFGSLRVPTTFPTPASLGMNLAASMVWTKWKYEMWYPAQMMPPLAIKTVVRIPTPPMGRQIILTFPPIYKERGGGDHATTGQLYPPKAP
jgi:hypothetical protein